jgi:hypothetical protein
MVHSFTSALFHCVFSTKDRRPFIDDHLRERVFPYMGGISREIRARALTTAASRTTFTCSSRSHQIWTSRRRCG